MYQRILVPYDDSPTSRRGLDEATRLAKSSGGRVRILHLIDDLSYASGFETGAIYASDVLPVIRKAGAEILERARARVAAAQVEVDTLLLENPGSRLAERVLDQAQLWQADLIVIGTHGRRGVARFLMGSDAEQILRLAPVPVLLVRSPHEGPRPSATR
ncbi:MAG: universal stress protein [Burkholderiaceae bacterium]